VACFSGLEYDYYYDSLEALTKEVTCKNNYDTNDSMTSFVFCLGGVTNDQYGSVLYLFIKNTQSVLIVFSIMKW